MSTISTSSSSASGGRQFRTALQRARFGECGGNGDSRGASIQCGIEVEAVRIRFSPKRRS